MFSEFFRLRTREFDTEQIARTHPAYRTANQTLTRKMGETADKFIANDYILR